MDKIELREEYLSGNMFQVGDLVEDINTGKVMQILDRGSNYITVSDEAGNVEKKWLTDVKESSEEPGDPEIINSQIVFKSVNTENLDEDTSYIFLEQYYETQDLFAWRHAIANVDKALVEENLDKRYEMLTRAEKFYENMNLDVPLVILTEKSAVEQKRVSDIIAQVAEVPVAESPVETVKASIAKLKADKITKAQWQILHPIFKAAKATGIPFSLSMVPNLKITEEVEDKIFDLIDQNLDEFINSIEDEDLLDAFDSDDLEEDTMSDDELNEVLSIGGRNKLKISVKKRKNQLGVRRMRALKRGATTNVLQNRARKLALTMLKRRMFKKAPGQMTRGEKERFEKGAAKRKVMIDRLSKRLIGRVRMLQKQRMKGDEK